MAGLPATPWLDSHPGDSAQHYTQGYGLGLSAASEQARINQQQAQLAQQAQQAQMQMEMQQKEHERNFLMEQQQMEIGKQYHQMQISLGQQKLEEGKALMAEQTKAAALQNQARMAIPGEIKTMMAQGIDEDTATMRAHLSHAQELYTGAGGGAMVNALNRVASRNDQAPMPRVDPASGALIDSKGVPHWKPGGTGQNQDRDVKEMYIKMIEQAQKDLTAGGNKEMQDRAQAALTAGYRGLNNLRYGKGPGSTQTGAAPDGAATHPQSQPNVVSPVKVNGKWTIPKSGSDSKSSQTETPSQSTKTSDEAAPATFDQFKKSLASLPPRQKEKATAAALKEVAKGLVESAGIPDKWEKLRIGSSSLYHDPADTLYGALTGGESHGITNKDVGGILDAQPPEVQQKIMGRALKAAGIDLPSESEEQPAQAQIPQASLPQAQPSSPWE